MLRIHIIYLNIMTLWPIAHLNIHLVSENKPNLDAEGTENSILHWLR